MNLAASYSLIIQAALKKFASSESSGQGHSEEETVPRISPTAHAKGPHSKRGPPGEVLDPFAIKVSIPPLVLFTYVVWKYYSAEDPRLKSIREAEEKHAQYMADLAEEKNGVAALHAAFNTKK